MTPVARTPPPGRSPCADCQGAGRVPTAEVRRRWLIFWRLAISLEDCWTCDGTGTSPLGRCPSVSDNPSEHDGEYGDQAAGYCWVCAEDGHTAGYGCGEREGLWP